MRNNCKLCGKALPPRKLIAGMCHACTASELNFAKKGASALMNSLDRCILKIKDVRKQITDETKRAKS